jgi:hypothetical protein
LRSAQPGARVHLRDQRAERSVHSGAT